MVKLRVQATDFEKQSDHLFVGAPLPRYRMALSITVSENCLLLNMVNLYIIGKLMKNCTYFIKHYALRINGWRVIASHKLDRIYDLFWRCGQQVLYGLEVDKKLITLLKISYALIICGDMMVSESNGCILGHSLSNFQIPELCFSKQSPINTILQTIWKSISTKAI